MQWAQKYIRTDSLQNFHIFNCPFTCSYFAEWNNLHWKRAALTNYSRAEPLSIGNESLSGVRTRIFLVQTFQPLPVFTFLSKKRFVFTFPAESWQVEDKNPVSIKPKNRLSIVRLFSEYHFLLRTRHIISHLHCSHCFTWAFLPVFNVNRLCCLWYFANILAFSCLPSSSSYRQQPLFSFRFLIFPFGPSIY